MYMKLMLFFCNNLFSVPITDECRKGQVVLPHMIYMSIESIHWDLWGQIYSIYHVCSSLLGGSNVMLSYTEEFQQREN